MISTILYGVVGLLSFVAAVYFFLAQEVFIFIICLVMVAVAADNFFCAHRARVSGIKVSGEYCIPFRR